MTYHFPSSPQQRAAVSLPRYQSPLPYLSPCRGPGRTKALGGDAGAAALPLEPPRRAEWAGQGPHGPPRPSPPSGPQAAPSLMPLGPRKQFLCPHDTPQAPASGTAGSGQGGSGAAAPRSQRSRAETITAPHPSHLRPWSGEGEGQGGYYGEVTYDEGRI